MSLTLSTKEYLDEQYGFSCNFATSPFPINKLHTHEFYEIILSLDDNTEHLVNNAVIHLKKNTLLFIRPRDEHNFKSESCMRFVNLAFSRENANSAFTYLGETYLNTSLLKGPLPQITLLTDEESRDLLQSFGKLNSIDDSEPERKKLYFQYLLIKILTFYFRPGTENKPIFCPTNAPDWLKNTCSAMHEKHNFYDGIDTMVAISGKSYAHLSKTLKHYYNKTVTEFINDIRLTYAMELLQQTTYPIIDISLEAGFQSVNWFNTCFKKKYGISPKQVRK